MPNSSQCQSVKDPPVARSPLYTFLFPALSIFFCLSLLPFLSPFLIGRWLFSQVQGTGWSQTQAEHMLTTCGLAQTSSTGPEWLLAGLALSSLCCAQAGSGEPRNGRDRGRQVCAQLLRREGRGPGCGPRGQQEGSCLSTTVCTSRV